LSFLAGLFELRDLEEPLDSSPEAPELVDAVAAPGPVSLAGAGAGFEAGWVAGVAVAAAVAAGVGVADGVGVAVGGADGAAPAGSGIATTAAMPSAPEVPRTVRHGLSDGSR